MYSLLDTNLFECHWYPSKLLLSLYIGCYVIALLTIGLLPLAIKWLLFIIVLLSSYVMWIGLKSVLLTLPYSFIAIRRNTTNWFIYSRKEGWQEIQLLPSGCIVLAWIVILQFRVEGIKRSFTVCLPIDGMLRNEHRKLRVYLRYLT